MTMNTSPEEQTKLLRANKSTVVSAKTNNDTDKTLPQSGQFVQPSSSTNSFNSLIPPPPSTVTNVNEKVEATLVDYNLNGLSNGIILNIPPNPSIPGKTKTFSLANLR
jgi:hypothetical protein